MIKPDMRVGDIFEDGGLHYQVQSVLPDGNYISKLVTEDIKQPEEDKVEELEKIEDIKQPEEAKQYEKKKYSRTEINRMSKDNLIILAKENDIEAKEDTSGADLKKALLAKFEL